ncbi:hypothetical protein AA15669_1927 [Saccharibacter floricola DSM 15669]|uniref:Uncharacterized protein n=2 Tax=Saccharibacter TaxID=231052 RepID=A0ABQ0P184_9PROT|nr:hypothetical protein [Saccharibacter floricola]GBQ08834.1 hypothetical protein AA15669_1927 [Saccharibacter floricola DSM 15669]
MRAFVLLLLAFAGLSSHTARAAPLPTLCTSEEDVVISGETPRGFASLCAGKNDVWHYRFGEPGHITYVFPRDNSPAQKNFVLKESLNEPADTIRGEIMRPRVSPDTRPDHMGSIFAFYDHGRFVYIFDEIRTIWGDHHHIIGKIAGIAFSHSSGTELTRLPFTRITAGSQWGDKLAKNSKLSLSFGHEAKPSDPYIYTGDFNITEQFSSLVQPTNIPPPILRDAHSDPEVSLCLPTEHILLSAETDHGYVSLCAGLHSWHYRTGTPNHLTYIFPADNSPPYKNFSFSRIKVISTIGDGDVYSFTDHHVQTTIFYVLDNRDDTLPTSEIAGLIQRKNHHIIKEILLKNTIDINNSLEDPSSFLIHLQLHEKLKSYDDDFVIPKKMKKLGFQYQGLPYP